jgi:hypothetical protein
MSRRCGLFLRLSFAGNSSLGASMRIFNMQAIFYHK